MERQLKAETQELFALAEQEDQAVIPDGVNLPEEIHRREDRLVVMAAAKAKFAERAQARYEKEKVPWHHQIGDGISAVLIARPAPGTRGMERCLSSVEYKTYGRIAPVGQENE